jgi:hypothetical protein
MRRVALLVLVLTACEQTTRSASDGAVTAAPVPPAPRFNVLARADFNLRAQEHFAPLFWRADTNADGVLDPDELVVTWGQGAKREDFVSAEGFTPAFVALYAALQKPQARTLSVDENARMQLLRDELMQGQPTLVETDTRRFSAEERTVLTELSAAALGIEQLYARQLGTDGLEATIAPDDLLSRAVFHRNHRPACVAPKTAGTAACTALPHAPRTVSGLYPAALQATPGFCAVLEKQPNASALMGHFTAVVAKGEGFATVPFSQAFAQQMAEVATHLEAAAKAVTSQSEATFKAYLLAAANAFRTDDWEAANVAWVAMSGSPSKWFLRVGPDEVYAEPCAWKATFALQLARIDPASLEWQQTLEPVKQSMERLLAARAGSPYKAREVRFALPDFIEVVLNAGDARAPHGGNVGQSLPNWGPTAEKGGRTMVMTNLTTDPDSQQALKAQMASLFCTPTMALASTEPRAALATVVLHEAAHNLGPAHDYAVKGRTDDQVFGGPLASTLEELKAESSAVSLVWWLVDQKRSSPSDATMATVRELAWAFGHLARGMYEADHHPRTYSQVAAIEVGAGLKASALKWNAGQLAANGRDQGCFELDVPAWRKAIDALATRTLAIKARGDLAGAQAMTRAFVDDEGDEWADLRNVISTRWLRAPKSTFLYGF